MKTNNKNSRRKFLDNGMKLGIVTAIGSLGLSKITSKLNAKPENNSDEKMELMTTDGSLIQVDSSEVIDVNLIQKPKSERNEREGFPNRKFVMVVDLARCKNALVCQKACNKNHYITGDNAWIKVYKMQESKDTAPYFMPTTCQHCNKPPCVTVCPVDATFKRRDGLVLIDNERCIGCRFCMAACPYSTRVFNWDEPNQAEIYPDMNMEDHVSSTPEYAGMPSIKGTVDKCDFCPHMIDKGEFPHCVNACPNNVFYFGDYYEDTVSNNDETVRLSELLKNKAGYKLMEGLGTEPSVYYLPPVDRLVDFEEALKEFKEFESVEKPE
jgi:Fe-S-cluster-containing dehydrogenase component